MVLDCREPRSLADFYARLLGGTIKAEDDTWVVVTDPEGRRLAFQQAPDHRAPEFPDPRGSQQFHLDVVVDDVEAAEAAVLELGATHVQSMDEDQFRVYRDPAGHTFCLVWSIVDE
ncbi:VOC family protein [Actinokineospora pegani]|uniref:VOC family protein n=1 Tax=Actinokineospora pegani TaxID=2654637 RepID=UPI001F16E180|nr:VOC family protein [Actinokineospora pegani]